MDRSNVDDLYGDIDEIEKSAAVRKLQEALKLEENLKESLEATVKEQAEQIKLLLNDRQQLEMNISALFNTALREIERKDRDISSKEEEISKLRSELRRVMETINR